MQRLNTMRTNNPIPYRLTSVFLLSVIVAACSAPHGRGGTEQVLYSFMAGTPGSGMIMDNEGNLYGTSGDSTIFKLTRTNAGNYAASTLYRFAGGRNVPDPTGYLVMDRAGDLYGIASGGRSKHGVVFRLKPDGSGQYTESTLYRFAGYALYGHRSTDGANPTGGLIMDAKGNLYGTTQSGGRQDDGTVFRLSPNGNGSYSETILYSFKGGKDGKSPAAGVVADRVGNLYGTTTDGGRHIVPACGINGCGTVFKLTRGDGGGYSESIIYRFSGGNTGSAPIGALIMDGAGDLYGTTMEGAEYGRGAVFKLTAKAHNDYIASVLYNVLSEGLTTYVLGAMDRDGNLYGISMAGGSRINCKMGCGTVFKLTPNRHGGYSKLVLYSFRGGTDGAHPVGRLTEDGAGNLYGTTVEGGHNDRGTVFRIRLH